MADAAPAPPQRTPPRIGGGGPPSGALAPKRMSSPKKSCQRGLLVILSHAIVALFAFNMGYIYRSYLQDASYDVLEASRSSMFSITDSLRQRPVSSKPHSLSDEQQRRLQSSLPIPTVGYYLAGMARARRDELRAALDLGVPWDASRPGNEDVLILYSNAAALPEVEPINETAAAASSAASALVPGAAAAPAAPVVPLYTARDATAKCHTVRLVLQQPKKDRECLVIAGQWESYTVDKFARLPTAGAGGTSDSLPLRHVPRGQRNNGRVLRSPALKDINNYWRVLTDYLGRMDSTVERLAPVAKAAAGRGKAIVVMTCNWGQAALLANFVCGARARNLDLSHILLFATDQETHDLAAALDIHSFLVDDAFGPMPKAAARFYGDRQFASMMMSKVYCVHLINMMGYDLLFQDVDMYWYKNPLDYFYSKEAGAFDMYFQDDGARSARYTPYSPNSGFYFVRNSARTQYFFSVFLRMGDLIMTSGSHQGAMTSLLVEHANWKGLLIKVFGVFQPEGRLFPGGYHYHRDRQYMRELIFGKVDPFIFHMSWTKNKDNKGLFMRQLGLWHLKDQCEDQPVEKVLTGNHGDYYRACCSAEPIVSCHYSDKPSKIPCKDRPPIDKGRRSFW